MSFYHDLLKPQAKKNSEPKTIFIHIGSYKTATSFIQNSFKLNEKLLLEEYGIFYPQIGLSTESFIGCRHYKLAKAVVKSKPKLFANLKTEFNNTSFSTMFLSSEYLSYLTVNEIRRLRDYLPDTKVKILFTVRSQDKFIESLYAEYTQHKSNILDFEGFIAQEKELLDYYKLAENWASIFGKKNIMVTGFENNKKIGVLENIFKCISTNTVQIGKLEKPKNVNVSIGEKKCNLMFNLNHACEQSRRLKKVGQVVSFSLLEDRPLSLFSPDEREVFLKSYEESNRKLINTFSEGDKQELINYLKPLPYKSILYRCDVFNENLGGTVKKAFLIQLLRTKLIHRYIPSIINGLNQKLCIIKR
jgi:hypothetical protein